MKKMTLIATGDAFITRRFPEGGYEGFEQVRDVISQYDVKFSNLEMTFHNEEGYPAALWNVISRFENFRRNLGNGRSKNP